VVGKYPEVGVRLIHREGARLQRYYVEPPPDRRGLLLPYAVAPTDGE
jgi:hypothetical protein